MKAEGSKYQQWKEQITSRRLAEAFGMEEAMVYLMKQRLIEYHHKWSEQIHVCI